MKKNLLVVLLLLCVTMASHAQIVKPVPAGFVYPEGTHFSVMDSKGEIAPFYFTGTNNYYLMYKPMNMVEDILDGMLAMNMKVVRMWFFMDGADRDGVPYLHNAPGVYNEVAFAAIDKVVAAAAARDLKILPVFVNYWSDFGGMQQYATWAGGSAGDFFTNATMKQTYKNYVAKWIDRKNTVTGVKYKDDPTIFAWQLTNEARGQNGQSAAVVSWANEMSTYIRSLDSYHMISMGDEGILDYTNSYCDANGLYKNFCYTGGQGDWVGLLKLANIDFGTVHNYWVDQWAIYDKNTKLVENTAEGVKWIKIHIDEANKVGKPCVMEEYNKADNGAWSTLNDQNRAYVMNEYQKVVRTYNGGMAGDLSWMMSGLNYVDPVEAGYTLNVTPPVDVTKLWLYRVKWGSDGHSYSIYDPLAGPVIKTHGQAMLDKNVVAAPKAFSQISPASLATNVSINAFLTWEVASYATSYSVVVADNAALTTPVLSQTGIKTPTVKVSGLNYQKKYYWSVTAYNIVGNKIASNSGSSFTTQSAPSAVGAFSLISPVASNTPKKSTVFTWGAAPNADFYQIKVSVNSDMSSPVIDVTDIASTTYISTITLTEGTTYYWQVTGINSLYSKSSVVGSFVSQLPSQVIDLFETYTNCSEASSAWVRNSGGAALDVCSETIKGVAEGTKSMKLHYSFSAGGYCGVMKSLGGQNFVGYPGIGLYLTGDASGNDFTLQIKEASGEYWELTRVIDKNSTEWLFYDFSSFHVASWSKKDGVLNLSSIAEIAIYFGNKGGTSDVYIDDLILSSGTPTSLNPKPSQEEDSNVIYPNPAKDKVTIRLNSTDSDCFIKLFSLTGSLLYSKQFDHVESGSITINLSDVGITSGVYFIDVDGRTTKLIVK